MNLFEDGGVTLGIRPEHVRLGAGGEIRGRVARRETTGADAYIVVDTPRGAIEARVPSAMPVCAGDEVALTLPQEFVRRFDRNGVALGSHR